MSDKTLAKGNGSALQPWESRDSVRELQERLALMLPGGAKLDKAAVGALAQGAILHGLDPLNGEIWYIPGRGLMIGVKGLRKKAREQVQGNFWIDFREITSPEERKRLRIPEGALAYEARLFDSENIRIYVDAVSQFTKAGIPWEAAREILGDKPYTSGIGVLAAGEQTKMQPAQCAMKRAEADALKRRFDVPFGMSVESDAEESIGQPWADSPVIDGATVKALWEEPEETKAEPPAPPPEREPKGDKPKSAKLQITKHADWQRLCVEFVKGYPEYQTQVKGKPNGQPNMFHVLGAAAACGFPTVTDANMETVVEAIAARAQAKAAEPEKAEEPS